MFVGEVSEFLVDEIELLLSSVASSHRKFTMRPDKICPSSMRTRRPLIWMRFHSSQKYTTLALDIRAALEAFAEKPDDRDPFPHLTLARPGKNPPNPRKLRFIDSGDAPQLEVERFELWKSELKPEGAIYTCLKEFELVG